MTASNGLPVIPLSPIVQSYILSSNALSQAHEKLTEAKRTNPPVSVDVSRRLIENVRVEKHRLEALDRKMQSVEAATPLFWDSDVLARQIAIVNSQLYSGVLLEKQALLSDQDKEAGLSRFIDFHNYLSHNMAHQLIYWVELCKPDNQTIAVPPITSKDGLTAHLVRVAYLLLHAYRDFSGFAAIMKALEMPQVRRLQTVWKFCSPYTLKLYQELSLIMSPANNYQAYRHFLYNKLELHIASKNVRVAIPWIQPHLFSIQPTNKEDKLDAEMSILELCQGKSLPDENPLLPLEKLSRTIKPIFLEGLRSAVIPVANLNSLVPGDLLTHHWLVSRVYLDGDQLMNESLQVESLRLGEEIVPSLASDIKIPSDVAHQEIKSANRTSSDVSSSLTKQSSRLFPVRTSKRLDVKYGSDDDESEIWNGYPGPSTEDEDDEEEIWKGYPGPNSSSSTTGSPRRTSSEASEEWKGYQATKMEADWRREIELKVKQCEWQGYTLENYDDSFGRIMSKKSVR